MKTQEQVKATVGDVIRVKSPGSSVFGENVLTVAAVTDAGVRVYGYDRMLITHGWYEIVKRVQQDWANVGDVVCVEERGQLHEFVVDKVTDAFVRGQNQRDYPGKLLEVRHGNYAVAKRADRDPYVCVYCDQGIKPFQDASYEKDGCWHMACKDAMLKNSVSNSIVRRIETEAVEYVMRCGFAPTAVVLGVTEMAELERLVRQSHVIEPLFPSVEERKTYEIGGVATPVGVLRVVLDERREHHLEVLG